MSSSESTAKRNTQKLQRAIVDGLEDVKAQDIRIYNTEHLSPLFERVIVASGTSNRQTKALASSVSESVKEAGFPKPRTEGEDNGEWIIVDCGAAVAHIMQPAIRQYYNLEEIWGDKPVRLRAPVAAPAARAKRGIKETGPEPMAAKPKPAPARASKPPAAKKAAPAKKRPASGSRRPAKPAAPIQKLVVNAPRKKPATPSATSARPKRAAPRKSSR